MSTLEEKIKVMQAYQQGKQIEYKYTSSESWNACASPVWNWTTCDYRIKEEPKKKVKLYHYLYRDVGSNKYYESLQYVKNIEEALKYSSYDVIKLLPHTMIEVEEE